MISFQLMFISSFSVIIPIFFIIINRRLIDRSFNPFLFLILLNLIHETFVWIILGKNAFDVRYSYNVYFLLEAFLITSQFARWGLFKRVKWMFYLFISSYSIVWLLDSFYFTTGGVLNSYFIIFYSFCIILMSLGMLNQIIKTYYYDIVLNPIFLICSTFLFFFIYTIITELLSLYPKSALSFRWNILNLLNIINIICNCGYGFAIWQMHKREKIHLSN